MVYNKSSLFRLQRLFAVRATDKETFLEKASVCFCYAVSVNCRGIGRLCGFHRLESA